MQDTFVKNEITLNVRINGHLWQESNDAKWHRTVWPYISLIGTKVISDNFHQYTWIFIHTNTSSAFWPSICLVCNRMRHSALYINFHTYSWLKPHFKGIFKVFTIHTVRHRWGIFCVLEGNLYSLKADKFFNGKICYFIRSLCCQYMVQSIMSTVYLEKKFLVARRRWANSGLAVGYFEEYCISFGVYQNPPESVKPTVHGQPETWYVIYWNRYVMMTS